MGYLHIYTGNGKGKTTAAFGLALRAHFAGKTIFIGQFVKNMKYHETQVTDSLSGWEICQLGQGCFIYQDPSIQDVVMAREGLDLCVQKMSSGHYGLVVLDELSIALYFKLLTREEVEAALDQVADDTEVVITGRYAPDWLIDRADLVTEMKEVKHYYSVGVEARDGIER